MTTDTFTIRDYPFRLLRVENQRAVIEGVLSGQEMRITTEELARYLPGDESTVPTHTDSIHKGVSVEMAQGDNVTSLRIAYADPPYPGMSRLYKNHEDYAGEVDHANLIAKLQEYDGWCLHTASTTLQEVLTLCPKDIRIMAWVKPFCAFKRNVAIAYAWEPVIVKPARARPYDGFSTITDWIAESITLRRGLTGAKPEKVCCWLFDVMGCLPSDELFDLFPGTSAVTRAWDHWRNTLRLPGPEVRLHSGQMKIANDPTSSSEALR